MGKILKDLMIALIWLSCASCSSGLSIKNESMAGTAEALVKSPQATPDFIIVLEPAPGENLSSPSEICAYMSLAAVWEPGDEERALWEHLTAHTTIIIDGQIVPFKDPGVEFHGVNLPGVPGAGRDFHACIGVDLQKGIHLAEVKVTTTAGRELSYSWAFRVK
jgi:hypothetical protein